MQVWPRTGEDSDQSQPSFREWEGLSDLVEAFFVERMSCNTQQPTKPRTQINSLDKTPCVVDGESDFNLVGINRTNYLESKVDKYIQS